MSVVVIELGITAIESYGERTRC